MAGLMDSAGLLGGFVCISKAEGWWGCGGDVSGACWRATRGRPLTAVELAREGEDGAGGRRGDGRDAQRERRCLFCLFGGFVVVAPSVLSFGMCVQEEQGRMEGVGINWGAAAKKTTAATQRRSHRPSSDAVTLAAVALAPPAAVALAPASASRRCTRHAGVEAAAVKLHAARPAIDDTLTPAAARLGWRADGGQGVAYCQCVRARWQRPSLAAPNPDACPEPSKSNRLRKAKINPFAPPVGVRDRAAADDARRLVDGERRRRRGVDGEARRPEGGRVGVDERADAVGAERRAGGFVGGGLGFVLRGLEGG